MLRYQVYDVPAESPADAGHHYQLAVLAELDQAEHPAATIEPATLRAALETMLETGGELAAYTCTLLVVRGPALPSALHHRPWPVTPPPGHCFEVVIYNYGGSDRAYNDLLVWLLFQSGYLEL